MVTKRIIPGISYAFIDSSGIEEHYHGTFAFDSKESRNKVDKQTIYDIASLTKVIATTTRILQLIDEGRLSYHNTVGQFLQTTVKNVSIAQLLLHCGGYAQDIDNKYSLNQNNIRENVLAQKSVYKPGTQCIYSDIGYLLLGMIIEEIDGVSLEESFRTHIFEPLKMKDTSYYCNNTQYCLPYETNKNIEMGEAQDYKARMMKEAGSAGLFMTLHDTVVFIQAFITKSPLLFSCQRFNDLLTQSIYQRTYGWSKEYGDNTLYHTGFTGTSIYMDMNKEQAFILYTNRIHPTRDNLQYLEKRKELIKLYQKEII